MDWIAAPGHLLIKLPRVLTVRSGHTDDHFSTIVYNKAPVFRVELEHMIAFGQLSQASPIEPKKDCSSSFKPVADHDTKRGMKGLYLADIQILTCHS
jgi:hypothetical protein